MHFMGTTVIIELEFSKVFSNICLKTPHHVRQKYTKEV